MIRTRKPRRGFTLVELMIAAGITVLIMTVLSICFQTSMKAMSAMRAQGDAADQLRALGEVMKRDAKADHHLPIESAAAVRNRGRRLSDYDFRNGATASTGFVVINSPASIKEGNDGVFDSYRNTGSSLWFTSVLTGGSEGNLYSALVNGQTLTSEAAEIAYFILPAGQTTGSPPQPLFNLYRRQRLVAPDTTRQAIYPTNDQEMVSVALPPNPNPPFVNTMATLTGGFRNGLIFTPLSGSRTGDDIILSNVLSFEVKPTWQAPAGLPGPRQMGVSNVGPGNLDTAFTPVTNNASSDAPYDSLSAFTAAGSQFDSLFPTPNHPRIRVNAVQIRIRIYDPKAKTARQATWIFDL
jgi:prepilin-type N-terminal cleavage/methylation domain-containing protein